AAVFAAFGLSIALLRHTGSIRRRIRSEPAMSLLGLVSLYEVSSLPSDQIWHMIYGLDIHAWSLPHLFIFGAASFMFLMACALLMSDRRDTQCESIRHVEARGLPVVVLVSLATWIALIIGVVEYEWRFKPGVAHASAEAHTFAGRPGWAYP